MTTVNTPFAKTNFDAHRETLDNLPVHWVRTKSELYRLIDDIDGIERVALDTEFIKRTTYFPILALVQVNTGQAIYLIDAPRLDLKEFWQALSEIPEMIWYACGEDLGIFYLLSECPPLTNVIDVQIGMAYLTGDLQMGYGRALNMTFGLELDKSESQSDWLMRPLSENQEKYAADDVRYLLALHDAVHLALTQKQIAAFAKEDMVLYAKELYDAQHLPDDQLYKEFLTPIYTHEQVAVLQALTMWRERLARSTNQPRAFIINRQAMREIVSAMPPTIKALAKTTINRSSLRLYGNEIIRLIKEAKQLPDNDKPPMPSPTYEVKNKKLKDKIKKEIHHFSEQTNVPSILLLKNRYLKELATLVMTKEVIAPPLIEGLNGYRQAWVLEVIIPLLQEHKAWITVGEEGGY